MGALREARSQLAAERTLGSPGGAAPPVAGIRDNGAPPLGGTPAPTPPPTPTHYRSLGP